MEKRREENESQKRLEMLTRRSEGRLGQKINLRSPLSPSAFTASNAPIQKLSTDLTSKVLRLTSIVKSLQEKKRSLVKDDDFDEDEFDDDEDNETDEKY